MRLLDPHGLAATVARIEDARLFGGKISKADAAAASQWIVGRYWQDIPEAIRNAAKPNPRWAAIPKSFNLTDAERRQKPRTFTGEALANAALRAVHSREAARALFILGEVLGKTAPEALDLCGSVRDNANLLEDHARALYCCGPCTASVLRLAGIGAPVANEAALAHLLAALPKHRDGRGEWRRFPLFYTLLALLELDHPLARAELRYARPACAKKRKGLEPKDTIATRRIAVLDRVLNAGA